MFELFTLCISFAFIFIFTFLNNQVFCNEKFEICGINIFYFVKKNFDYHIYTIACSILNSAPLE